MIEVDLDSEDFEPDWDPDEALEVAKQQVVQLVARVRRSKLRA
jgi:hypothetical protein